MMKKCLALLLAVSAALGLCAGVQASVSLPGEITDVSEDFGSGGYFLDGVEQKRGHIDDLAHLTNTQPGTEIFLPLRTKDFEWADSNQLPIIEKYAEHLGIELWDDRDRGSNVFDAITLTTRDGKYGLLVDFVDEWPSVEEEEFLVYAAINAGTAEYEFEIRGTFKNRNRYVYATSTTATLGVGRTATGYTDVSGVRFDLGSGVSITSDIDFFETVYGAAKEETHESDKELLAKYPQIVKVLHVDTINLSGNVRIDTGELGVLHVYSGQLTYLGTTAGPVRREDVYYLCTAKLAG